MENRQKSGFNTAYMSCAASNTSWRTWNSNKFVIHVLRISASSTFFQTRQSVDEEIVKNSASPHYTISILTQSHDVSLSTSWWKSKNQLVRVNGSVWGNLSSHVDSCCLSNVIFATSTFYGRRMDTLSRDLPLATKLQMKATTSRSLVLTSHLASKSSARAQSFFNGNGIVFSAVIFWPTAW